MGVSGEGVHIKRLNYGLVVRDDDEELSSLDCCFLVSGSWFGR